jgi:hypothetical protein
VRFLQDVTERFITGMRQDASCGWEAGGNTVGHCMAAKQVEMTSQRNGEQD